MTEETRVRWRLVLGRQADPEAALQLTTYQKAMDAALGILYNEDRTANLGNSAPRINRWLRDIRTYFPISVVQLLQKDALDRLGLKQMLLQPELLASIVPDVHLAAVILSLNKALPEATRATAREVVRQVVEDLQKKLQAPLLQALRGSLYRQVRQHPPKPADINWSATIRKNLKHYQPAWRTIIPQDLVGYGRKGQHVRQVILLVDQSGSMTTSVIYAAVLGAVMASLRSIRTQVVVFDTSVVDLTAHLSDPVDLLFAAQLGGGTDINQALAYAQTLLTQPRDTILVLISDLYEGGNQSEMLQRAATIVQQGVQFISLLALNDEGAPAYDRSVAGQFVQMGIPTFACTPQQFPEVMAATLNRQNPTLRVATR